MPQLRINGEKIVELRLAAGESQERLAVHAGISAGWLRKLEKGSPNATLRTINAVAGALGVDPAVLLK